VEGLRERLFLRSAAVRLPKGGSWGRFDNMEETPSSERERPEERKAKVILDVACCGKRSAEKFVRSNKKKGNA